MTTLIYLFLYNVNTLLYNNSLNRDFYLLYGAKQQTRFYIVMLTTRFATSLQYSELKPQDLLGLSVPG